MQLYTHEDTHQYCCYHGHQVNRESGGSCCEVTAAEADGSCWCRHSSGSLWTTLEDPAGRGKGEEGTISRLCHILSSCDLGMKPKEIGHYKETANQRDGQKKAEGWRLTSVGAGLLDSSVLGWASDISDNFSSSSSWIGDEGDLRVLAGEEDC
ncbi:hypothetical protein CRUP_016148 [Coryphaenoides rupestris]|nr:hypothetical protein CRUP_016148 [Coryphaenoides rupestris]